MPNNKALRKTISVVETGNVHLRGLNMDNISPLQRFVRAKKRINQTFEELSRYLKESARFVADCDVSDHFDRDTQKDLEQVNVYLDQVSGITEVLSRDHMKVAFFGRTSNGKSTVINAMLKDRILPSGLGHTTNCFVSVNGLDGDDAYIITPNSGEKKNVASLQQLAHALGDEKIDSSSLITVYWPNKQCTLLRDDVVFVDSPGIDVTPDLDSWIDKHCLDADVFVLVVNSESTLNQTEKGFFYKVNARLSRPNIFILNNRWDASADDDPEMIAKVKQQHLERTTDFLSEELKCISKKEAIDRVFFVSALETLRNRMMMKRQGIKSPSVESLTDMEGSISGQTARLLEFENFEMKFQECISKTAITTKFESHASRGINIVARLREIMEQLVGRAYSQRQWCEAQRQELEEQLMYMTSRYELIFSEIKSKIISFSEEVEQQVSIAMSEEIKRLGYLVDDFDYPFHPHHQFLRNYKKELHSYIETGLGKNLKATCSAPLLDAIEAYKSEMIDRVHSIIPADAGSCIIPITPRHDFEVSYELDIHRLCSDFHEDITFQFSLGWSNLVRKYLAPRHARLAFLLGAKLNRTAIVGASNEPRYRSRPRMEDEAEPEEEASSAIVNRRQDQLVEYPGRYDEDELTVAVIQAFASLYSTTSATILVVLGLIWRALGWKLIVCIGGSYAGLYLVERARWTNNAKEKCFKKQFVEFAAEKLQLVVSFTSKSCSHQVENELSMTFEQLQSQVDAAKEKLKKEIEGYIEEMRRLEELESQAKILRNRASWLESELDSFIKEFNLSKSKV